MQLEHQQILVVEDDFLIAMDLAETLREAGAEVVGPAATVAQALELLSGQPITAAVLDVTLGKDVSLAVAQRLAGAGIPFVYHSGQIALLRGAGWPKAPVINKPALPSVFVAAVARAAQGRAG
ncbi:MAG: response regulator [Rhodobacteraceae bacterium]|nr:MAG: response regulator [Paracoccaceae bacterium]